MLYEISYLLVLLGALLSFLASMYVKSTFRKYAAVISRCGMTSQDAAVKILNEAGIYDVTVVTTPGELTDHYAPNEKVLRLSDSVYGSGSVAAIGVAAHECGHAIQHSQQYALLGLRSMAVPVANFGSRLSWPIVLLGLLIRSYSVAEIGVVLFIFVVAFQLLTLPIEIDASRRAISVLQSGGILDQQELTGAQKVLMAAAFTYVATLFTSIMQLLRLIAIVNGGSGRRRR